MKCKINILSHLRRRLESNFRSWSKWPFECVYKTNHLDAFHLLCLKRLYFNGLKVSGEQRYKVQPHSFAIADIFKGKFHAPCVKHCNDFAFPPSADSACELSLSPVPPIFVPGGAGVSKQLAQYSALWNHAAQPCLHSRSRGHFTSGFSTNLM